MSITAARASPIGKLMQATTNDNRGDDRLQRIAKMKWVGLFQNTPLSNNIMPFPHTDIIPGSSLVRTVSGIQPNSVGSSGVSAKTRQIKDNG